MFLTSIHISLYRKARSMQFVHPGVLSRRPLYGLRLLALAHLALLATLLLFFLSNHGSVLDTIGLVIYAGLAVASLAVLLFVRRTRSVNSPFRLILISLPTVAVFCFWAGLRGAYAPYDPFDVDLIRPIFVGMAILFSFVAICFRSIPFLLTMAGTQFVVYFAIYVPQFLHYPGANLLGTRPAIFIAVAIIYLVAGFFVTRNALGADTGSERELDLGTNLLVFAGGLFLCLLLAWLPDSGDVLGYQSGSPQLVGGAWVWTRTLASTLALIALLCALWNLVTQALVRFRRPALVT